jgi:IS30 family transposase
VEPGCSEEEPRGHASVAAIPRTTSVRVPERRFTVATDIKVDFCDPQNPWQRGTHENTNGPWRRYFPKGTDLSGYSQAKLNAAARRLNQRPRKTLNHQTPAGTIKHPL